MKEGAVPVLFAWNSYSLPEGELSEEEPMDVERLLQCHNYAAKPEHKARDCAPEDSDAQRLVLELQSFGLERFSASDDDIRFYTR